MAALPALTTIFTPPSYCLSTITPYTNLYGYSTYLLAAPSLFPQCYPPSATLGLTFSPGVCPQGHVSIAQTLKVIDSANNETQIECCPRTLPMVSEYPNLCLATTGSSHIYAPMIRAYYQSTDTAVASLWSSILGKAVSPTTSTQSSPSDPTVTSSVLSPLGSLLNPLQDTSSTSSLTSSRTSSQSPLSSLSPPNRSQLSAGAIAGIVIGAILGFLLLLGGLLLFLRQRKWKRIEMAASPVEERKWNDDSAKPAEGRRWNDDSQQRRWEEAGESRRL